MLLNSTLDVSKPDFGAEVDADAAAGMGMIACYMLNELAGNLCYDSFAGNIMTGISGPTWGDSIGRYGPGGNGCMRFSESGVSYLRNLTLVLPTNAVTVRLICNPLASGNTSSAFGNVDSSSISAARCQAHLPFSGTVYWDFGGATGANRITWTPPGGFFGSYHDMVFTAGPLGSAIYSDGQLVSSQATAITRTQTALGFAIGHAFNDGSSNDILVESVIVCNRQATQEDVDRLRVEPYWFMLRPAVERYYSIASGATTYFQTMSASSAAAPSLIKQINAIRAGSSSSAAAVVKQANIARSAASAGSASVVKQAGVVKSAASAGSGSLVKMVGRVLSASSAGAAVLSSVKVRLQTMAASSTAAASVIRSAGRVWSASSSGAVSLAKRVGRVLTATSAGAAVWNAIKVVVGAALILMGYSASGDADSASASGDDNISTGGGVA